MGRWCTWRRALVLGIGSAVAAGSFAFHDGRPERAPVGPEAARTTEQWLGVLRQRARNGFWIVVRGTHVGDEIVAAGSVAQLTHAAVYDRERDEIIEAVGTGVACTPLRELIAQARRVQLIRPHGYTEDEGRRAVERARSRIGADYDWLGTLGAQSDRRFYCTELALDAYRARERGWMPAGVIHPEHMTRFGDLVFESGSRPSEPAAARIADELRERFADEIAAAEGVDYAALVAPGIYRGGQPDAAGVRWLRSIGVRTVVNLRHYHGEREGKRVRAAGMRYLRIPLESTDPPTAAQVQAFLAVVNDPEARPVYIHCLHGVDRTGAMIAVYRMQQQGWSNADALAEMEHFGAHGILHDLRRYVGAYTPR